ARTSARDAPGSSSSPSFCGTTSREYRFSEPISSACLPPGNALYRLPGLTPVARTRSSTEVARQPRAQNSRMAVSRTCWGSNSRGRGTPATIQERSFKNKLGYVDFAIPADLAAYLGELDEFIEREIRPLEQQDDNIRFFDYRREDARTDWDRGGLPNRGWE